VDVVGRTIPLIDTYRQINAALQSLEKHAGLRETEMEAATGRYR